MPYPDVIRWTLIAWLTVLGGCVGSFLNVVVYRLPRGKSLVHPGSHCPRCNNAIRWWHNLPVFGWLMLRGRCFDCREPIAPRYPIVEAIVAFWFGAIAWYGPLAATEQPTGNPDWLWKLYGYHVILCCVLICLVLIDWDSATDDTARYPTQLWIAALLVGVIAPIVDDRLHPITIWIPLGQWSGMLGAVAGALVGYSLFAAVSERRRGSFVWRPVGWIALIGAFLGSIPTTVIGVAAVGAGVVTKRVDQKINSRTSSHRWSSATMLVGVTICVLIWKSLA